MNSYAYAFVLFKNQVCVFKHTGTKLLFVCLEALKADFWEDFIERYNIEANKAKDFAFVWDNKGPSLLDNPHFQPQLDQRSLWNRQHMRDLLDILDRQHQLRASLKDSIGRVLEGGDLHLHTNAYLELQEIKRTMNPTTSSKDKSVWQRDQEELTRTYEGKEPQKETTPQARDTSFKLKTGGGEGAPKKDEEPNH
ncbi:hypothetical protein [Helicobacter cynogastricus]|uniref:hypothetical protein n=1 Tax=Helicobacter cynogastricus TaxID=329937 RepID=UPI000CF09F55|nr:hypothetical protein [Helicobacter cynogastricus]